MSRDTLQAPSGRARPDVMTDDRQHRTVRSYVLRAGRLTKGQERALSELWPRFGIDYSGDLLHLDAVFGRSANRMLEIGFGNGEGLVELAERHPEYDYLGVEVHKPGVGRLLMRLEREGLPNVRVICHDAVEVLETQIPDCALTGVNIYFPDPWPKKRHHKRRLIQAEFLVLLARKLEPGGRLQLATDWESYAEHMLEVCEASPYFDNTAPGGGYSPRPDSRPPSKFERRGLRLGQRVRDLVYRRNEEPVSG